MLSYSDAIAAITGLAATTVSEDLPLLQALGRVLAEDVRLAGDQPPFDRATMDGYAVMLAGDASRFAVRGTVAGFAAGLLLLRDGEADLVVYCAHDAVHAQELLAEFTRRTGIRIAVKYDGESAKSLGLVERILREDGRPEADLFWNNELLGTLLLAERGLLEPWQVVAPTDDENGRLDVGNLERQGEVLV